MKIVIPTLSNSVKSGAQDLMKEIGKINKQLKKIINIDEILMSRLKTKKLTPDEEKKLKKLVTEMKDLEKSVNEINALLSEYKKLLLMSSEAGPDEETTDVNTHTNE